MIANALIVLSILFLAVFVAQHFMAPPRPAWHKDLGSLGLVSAILAGAVRSREGRRSTRTVVIRVLFLVIILVILTYGG